MPSVIKRWCKEGCGKKVVFTGWRGKGSRFICEECNRIYLNLEELK